MQHRARMYLHMGLLVVSVLAVLPAWVSSTDLLPPVQTQGTVTYVRGGIGREEAQAFVDAAQRYPLTLEFTVQHVPQTTLTDQIHVQIHSAQGNTVLDTMSHGPFLLVNIPAGVYTVHSEYNGQELTRSVYLTSEPGRSAYVVFLWKSPW